MPWTDLTFAFEQVLTSDEMNNLDANFDALAAGDAGAPAIQNAALAMDPEHATDSGTDTYDSATNTTVPGDGVKIVRDFRSANTTTTPTLDGKTMTTRDGSALWSGAVSGPHELQYASGTDTYLVLGPILAQEQPLVFPGTSSDPALAFDTWRTPNANRPTKVVVRAIVQTNGTSSGDVRVDVDDSGGTARDYSPMQSRISSSANSGTEITVAGEFTVRAGGSYQIANISDPDNENTISGHREFTL